MPDCPASGQEGTGTKKADAETTPELECSGTELKCRCWNADAGGISLDADGQLW